MKYTATLNGKQYEVELERIDAYEPMPRYGEAPAVAPAPVAAPAAPAPAPAVGAFVGDDQRTLELAHGRRVDAEVGL